MEIIRLIAVMRGEKWNHFITWLVKWNDELDKSVNLICVLKKESFGYSRMGM